jgi:hypothetical protein
MTSWRQVNNDNVIFLNIPNPAYSTSPTAYNNINVINSFNHDLAFVLPVYINLFPDDHVMELNCMVLLPPLFSHLLKVLFEIDK